MRRAMLAQAVEVARLEILAIADLDGVAKRRRQSAQERIEPRGELTRARPARAKFEDQRRDAGAIGLQRLQK